VQVAVKFNSANCKHVPFHKRTIKYVAFSQNLGVKSCKNVTALQCGLDALATWSTEWQLTISNTKSSVLCLNPSTVTQSYTINQSSIGLVHEMCDLGVTIDSKLTMSQHVSKIVSKARMRANLIFKCFHSRDHHTLLKAYITYV